ncbi:14178_t:CDS:2, partial [Funneliformis geosporum]
ATHIEEHNVVGEWYCYPCKKWVDCLAEHPETKTIAFLLVYQEGELRVFPTDRSSSSNARNLRNYLMDGGMAASGKFYNNPILAIYPNPNNSQIKPLSVIRVEKRHKMLNTPFKHVGVYLGKNQVCHVYGYSEDEKNMKAQTTNISLFLGDTATTKRSGNVEEFRQFIPFIHWSDVKQRIAWIEQRTLFQFRIKPLWWSLIVDAVRANNRTSNNNKGQTIKICDEINESKKKLGLSNNWRFEQLEQQILIPPKENKLLKILERKRTQITEEKKAEKIDRLLKECDELLDKINGLGTEFKELTE